MRVFMVAAALGFAACTQAQAQNVEAQPLDTSCSCPEVRCAGGTAPACRASCTPAEGTATCDCGWCPNVGGGSTGSPHGNRCHCQR